MGGCGGRGEGEWPGGGVGRFLARWEREEIAVGLAQKLPYRQIAARLAPGRSAPAVCREVARNGVGGVYRAHLAEREALARARRPKPAKLAVNAELREWVQQKLMEDWSPEQISARLKAEFPGKPETPGAGGDDLSSRCMCRAGRCAGSWRRICGPGGMCAGRGGPEPGGVAGWRAW